MLSLQMKSGDYLTIGEDVVVQVFKGTGSQFRVSVKAPRQVPILRGEVRERSGDQRPQGLLEHPPKKSPSTQARAARQMEKLAQRTDARRQAAQARADAVARMRTILTTLSDQAAREALAAQLDRLETAEVPSDKEAAG